MDLKEIKFVSVNSIDLAQDRDQLGDLVNKILKLHVM
jgi:hypothetical protein